MDKQQQIDQATRQELASGARRHYEMLSGLATHWSSSVRHAIDAWEREPALQAEIERLRRRDADWQIVQDFHVSRLNAYHARYIEFEGLLRQIHYAWQEHKDAELMSLVSDVIPRVLDDDRAPAAEGADG